jgi:hypothetical protein
LIPNTKELGQAGSSERQTGTAIVGSKPTNLIDSSVRQSGRNNKREPGYYKKLHERGLEATKARFPDGKGQDTTNAGTNLQMATKPMLQVGPCLTALKAEHIINYNPNLPKNYKQARKLSDFELRWLPVMRKQFERLESRNTWELCPRPKDEKVLPGKWVYDEKIDPDNSIRARARWVVCGNYEEDS